LAIPCLSQIADPPRTFCNPLNLNYRFMSNANDAREAADPVIVLFQNDYYLFASKVGGYWVSHDLVDWELIIPKGIPLEDYAPTVLAIEDTLYFTAFNTGVIYSTMDPKSGQWQKVANLSRQYPDPALFKDDNNRVYMYYGCSNVTPLFVVEVDPANGFTEISEPVAVISAQASIHGWERRGDDNLIDEQPWIEGCWMTKHQEKYYLQYAGPGTEYITYADGLYIGDNPLGPFKYVPYSPFSFKPTGFITGGGHGCTFQDRAGNYWRVTTLVVSVKHIFERRIGIYPAAFDVDSMMYTNTVFGDYPQFLPDIKANPIEDNLAGWMLLSYKKYATASSEMEEHPLENAVDENVKTDWCAETGDKDEWFMLDLGIECQLHALQVNFTEQGTSGKIVNGRQNPLYQQYMVESSLDSVNWTMMIDKSTNEKDVPHDYMELAKPVQVRYIRITNLFTPGEGQFGLRDFRVFGNPDAEFTQVDNVTVTRDPNDGRDAYLRWETVENADGYIIRYGIQPDKLYNHYMVYDTNRIAIHSLNHGIEYYFSVEAFDSGTDFYKGDYTGIGLHLDPPIQYSLLKKFSNPFNPETNITYSIPKASQVTLQVCDVIGRKVRTLVDAFHEANHYSMHFNAENLSSGMVLAMLQIDEGFVQKQKMVLIK
ncbi:family 43 glycosylhydrolase, partial [bacterium]